MTTDARQKYDNALSILRNEYGPYPPRETVADTIEALYALLSLETVDVNRNETGETVETRIGPAFSDYEIEQIANGSLTENELRKRPMQYTLVRTIALRCFYLLRRAQTAEACAKTFVDEVANERQHSRMIAKNITARAEKAERELATITDQKSEVTKVCEELALMRQRAEKAERDLEELAIVTEKAIDRSAAAVACVEYLRVFSDPRNESDDPPSLEPIRELVTAYDSALQNHVVAVSSKQPDDREKISILARVAGTNPDSVRFVAQLLGVPACPKCDYVMRPGHVCKSEATK